MLRTALRKRDWVCLSQSILKMPRFRLVILLGILSPVLGTYVHLTEKCFSTASHSYCTRFHPSNFKGCLVRLDRKNLVMKVEDATICYTGNLNGKCISNEVCSGSGITTLEPSTTATTTAKKVTTTTATTTTVKPAFVDSNPEDWQEGLQTKDKLDPDLSTEDWLLSHPEDDWNTAKTHHESNPFSVIGLATPIEVVLFGTLIALGAMLILYMVLLGCQVSFVRAQKRTYDSLDAILMKTFKHLADIEEGMRERSLRVQTASVADCNGPAILPTLPAQNSFQPDGASALTRTGSTGAIPKSSQAKSARGTGSLFGSLTRAKPPTAPPLAPRRSQRSSSGYRRTQNSLPALDQFEEFEMEESHV